MWGNGGGEDRLERAVSGADGLMACMMRFVYGRFCRIMFCGLAVSKLVTCWISGDSQVPKCQCQEFSADGFLSKYAYSLDVCHTIMEKRRVAGMRKKIRGS